MPVSKHTRKGQIRKHVQRPMKSKLAVKHPQKSITLK